MALNEKVVSDLNLDIPEGEAVDLLEYLLSLDDDDRTHPEQPKFDEVSDLANLIRARTWAMLVTPLTVLKNQEKNIKDILEKLSKDQSFDDIVYIKNDSDTYYFSNGIMSRSFAQIAVLVAEKDYAQAMANTIRERCQNIEPTQFSIFVNAPFFLTSRQVDEIRQTFENDPKFEDIKEFKLENNNDFFYSNKYAAHEEIVKKAQSQQFLEPRRSGPAANKKPSAHAPFEDKDDDRP
jgi:hypothetical protein